MSANTNTRKYRATMGACNPITMRVLSEESLFGPENRPGGWEFWQRFTKMLTTMRLIR